MVEVGVTPGELHCHTAPGLFLVDLHGNILEMNHYWSEPTLKTCVLMKLDVFTSACLLRWLCVQLKLDLLPQSQRTSECAGFFWVFFLSTFFLRLRCIAGMLSSAATIWIPGVEHSHQEAHHQEAVIKQVRLMIALSFKSRWAWGLPGQPPPTLLHPQGMRAHFKCLMRMKIM